MVDIIYLSPKYGIYQVGYHVSACRSDKSVQLQGTYLPKIFRYFIPTSHFRPVVYMYVPVTQKDTGVSKM